MRLRGLVRGLRLCGLVGRRRHGCHGRRNHRRGDGRDRRDRDRRRQLRRWDGRRRRSNARAAAAAVGVAADSAADGPLLWSPTAISKPPKSSTPPATAAVIVLLLGTAPACDDAKVPLVCPCRPGTEAPNGCALGSGTGAAVWPLEAPLDVWLGTKLETEARRSRETPGITASGCSGGGGLETIARRSTHAVIAFASSSVD